MELAGRELTSWSTWCWTAWLKVKCVFWVCVCVFTEVVQQFTVFCRNWTQCFVPTGVKEIDIAATLEHVRDQRPGMVRTKVVGATSSCYLLAVKFVGPLECWQLRQLFFCNLSLLGIFTLDSNLKNLLRVCLFAASDCLIVVSCCLQDQFEFALTAVAEEVNAILKALPQWNQEVPVPAQTTKPVNSDSCTSCLAASSLWQWW